MKKRKDPKAEWGFFAMVPRIVRTQYPELGPSEKWLYTCLKDLCGDKGACFRTLPVLAEETGLSTGSLSTMIPALHEAGLIHATKKARGLGGKKVWHITIIDIWSANQQYCSNSEEQQDDTIQNLNNTAASSAAVIQNMNNVVQNLNNTSGSCSNFETSCSNFADRRKTSEEDISQTNEEEEGTSSADAPDSLLQDLSPVLDELIEETERRKSGSLPALSQATPAQQLSAKPPQQREKVSRPVAPARPVQSGGGSASPVQGSAGKRPVKVTIVAFSEGGKKVFDAWSSLFKSPPRAAEKTAECANDLYDRLLPWCQELKIPCRDLLKDIKNWLYASDPDYYRRRGVTLCDIGREFERWQSAKTYELSDTAQSEKKPRITSSTVRLGSPPKNDNHMLYSTEELRAQNKVVLAEMAAEMATPEFQAKLAEANARIEAHRRMYEHIFSTK